MKLVFLETPLFTRLLDTYLTDESYRELQRTLMENPEVGDVMPGTGGFRKVRWEDARRGKGKRGGHKSHLLLPDIGSADLVLHPLRQR